MAMSDTVVSLVQIVRLLLNAGAAAAAGGWLTLVFVLVFEMVKMLRGVRQKCREKKKK